jgi:DNA-binding CsgD family transcriptional regulator
MMVDPVIFRALSKPVAFRWEDVPHPDPKQQVLLEQRIKHGMEHGFSCAGLGAQNFFGLINFAGPVRVADEPWPRLSVALDLLTQVAIRACLGVIEESNARAKELREALTEMEIHVLEQAGQGKTAEEVGEHLQITKHGVRFHLEQAAQKLGCKSRREVVTEAMHLGIIRKRHFEQPRFSDIDD